MAGRIFEFLRKPSEAKRMRLGLPKNYTREYKYGKTWYQYYRSK